VKALQRLCRAHPGSAETIAQERVKVLLLRTDKWPDVSANSALNAALTNQRSARLIIAPTV
jgi:hypothetical protein